MKNCTEIIFSQRACNSITAESVYKKPGETAGILLGTVSASTCYVVESIDPGATNLINGSGHHYDASYVNHLAEVLSRQYSSKIELLGRWHSSFESFGTVAGIENGTTLAFPNRTEEALILCFAIVKDSMRLTLYRHSHLSKYEEVDFKIGDHLIPQCSLKYKYDNEIRMINFNQRCRPAVIKPRCRC